MQFYKKLIVLRTVNELKLRPNETFCMKLDFNYLFIYLFKKNAWYVFVSENYEIDLTLQVAFSDQSWTEKRTIRKGENLDRVGWNESSYSKIDVQINLGLHDNKTNSSIAMPACQYVRLSVWLYAFSSFAMCRIKSQNQLCTMLLGVLRFLRGLLPN